MAQWSCYLGVTDGRRTWVMLVGAMLCVTASQPGRADSAYKLAGFERLQRKLGAHAPTGRHIIVGHVEGRSSDYLPQRNHTAFGGVTFLAQNGISKVSAHATATAKVLYGPKGLAPGIGQVYCFSGEGFVGLGMLGVGSGDPPRAGGIPLFNHSWIGRDTRTIGDTLRRLDYLIDQDDTIMVVGVNNGAKSKLPALLASAYNVIAVGQWDGQSSGGYTQVETAGRCKPDLVGPGSTTSYATPVVTAIVARLLETVDVQLKDEVQTKARHAEVIKAVLLAGATKLKRWRPQKGKPLARYFGAGRASMFNSYTILTAGASEHGRLRKRYGWEFNDIKPQHTQTYRLDLRQALRAASLIVTWHRRVEGTHIASVATKMVYWLNRAKTADLNLRLIRLDEQGRRHVVAESVSAIDNVEHIFLRSLKPGRYLVQVERQDDLPGDGWDYALAWRMELVKKK